MGTAAQTTVKSQRLLSLDVLRGITIVGMIVVNNAGGPVSWDYLKHSTWNGMTPCDLVFPFFLFIMGVTTYLSLSKQRFEPSRPVITKIVRRAVLIILIGWALHWFGLACKGEPFAFDRLRLTGVLPRIGLCFGVVSLMALFLSRKTMVWSAVALLVLYSALMCLFNGYENDSTNFNAVVDRFLVGASHLYHKSPVDPEGIASTVSALAHTIIGFCCGAVIKRDAVLADKVLTLFVIGFMLMAGGFLLTEWMPLNKRVWSPTFVLVTTGLASMLLATLIYFIDMQGHRRWCRFFESFGVNPLFLYVFSELLATLVGRFGTKRGMYESLLSVIPDPELASAVYAVGFMLLCGAIAWPLYRHRIYIKI